MLLQDLPWDDAFAALRARWLAATHEDSNEVMIQAIQERVEASRPTTVLELFSLYDFGEPDLNGCLVHLAKNVLKPRPESRRISDLDELSRLEGVGNDPYWHHGDLEVSGDLELAYDLHVTGSLRVKGVLRSSYLDAFCELIVGGEVRAHRSEWMGLGCIFGPITTKHLTYIHPQGVTHMLGQVRAPLVLADTSEWLHANFQADKIIVVDETTPAALASALGAPTPNPAASAYDVLLEELYGKE